MAFYVNADLHIKIMQIRIKCIDFQRRLDYNVY